VVWPTGNAQLKNWGVADSINRIIPTPKAVRPSVAITGQRLGKEQMSGAAEPVGTLDVALAHTARLLESQPLLAAEQATEILKAVPNQPVASLLLAIARRSCGESQAALGILQPLVHAYPDWDAAHYELGLTLGSVEQGDAATAELRRAVALNPEMTQAWRALGDRLTIQGDAAGADEAYASHIKSSIRDPRLLEAGAALVENRIAHAEALLREHLRQYPTDVVAIRMFAEVAGRLGRYADAENLLVRCLELAPGFTAARHNYAVVLHRQSKAAAALPEIDRLLAVEPHNPSHHNLKAAILARIGEYQESIEIYARVLRDYPQQGRVWMSYGHALKTAGREAECIDAYRKCIELLPTLGEAYWSLANLKTYRFSIEDLAAMRRQLDEPGLTDADRLHFHFSIGKALEDAAEYAASFEHYLQGNRLRRGQITYDADETSQHVRRSKALFSREFFAQRAGVGSTATDPIFIVGLPRAGSTLLEQILSSHSAVEGTMELPDILVMAKSLGGKPSKTQPSTYPEVLATLSPQQCLELGERYIQQTRIQRKTAAPFFIDKMPNNFAHVGLIHLALPHAKIIDARRHPLGCCFSGFKQHFARGQSFTYSLEEVGRYYHDYVELMAHFDEVLPGRVHRVHYEAMIEDTEGEVRRLLEYCGLPFEASCLTFYQNERAVRTASSQQVRKPIFREGVDHWRHYEPWLAPLQESLGAVLGAYPAAPRFGI
jgi:predicted Zn-dependent protease